MNERMPQTFANHRRFEPLYHLVTFGLLGINLIWRLVQVVRLTSWPAVSDLLVALALMGLFFYTRIFALTVQDRVIRLEMRLRLAGILPPDLQGRIGELTRDQFVALRFASDAEMADLLREVLTNNITSRDEIKRRIKDWTPDYLRV
jgi:hypothetical protein